MPIRAVLFDLDGTLLHIDLGTFLDRYFHAFAEVVTDAHPHVEALDTVVEATRAVQRPHSGSMNTHVFHDTIAHACGTERSAAVELVERFCRDVHPGLGDGTGAKPGAREAVERARGLGLRVAVATHPIFPAAAIRQRLAWAGFDAGSFDLVTDIDNSHAVKPSPDYYRHIARVLRVEPSECLMVGDDRALDLAAGNVGMTTFYVGTSPDAVTRFRGDLHDLAALLPRLAGADLLM